ncbi:hypothetical protein AVEN_110807-1 [Araneus ventricosus]|uniref:Tc1-like transposase DDE domain-containing protein n=1 Tax=Araneus ventricosus TaxID=182803 RepID=A0A4Y2GH50_ARAVE|nr:hypothetical protein AVEN_110807-1 [Araneus ventricosus]
MGTDAKFMDDNARSHRARLVRSYLESKTIPQMARPARSPDLNAIEHVWDMLERRIAGRIAGPRAPTTGTGITATTSDQRHYYQHISQLSSMHFS